LAFLRADVEETVSVLFNMFDNFLSPGSKIGSLENGIPEGE
jgi:hypothetical protein